jgi:hypothetical protein
MEIIRELVDWPGFFGGCCAGMDAAEHRAMNPKAEQLITRTAFFAQRVVDICEGPSTDRNLRRIPPHRAVRSETGAETSPAAAIGSGPIVNSRIIDNPKSPIGNS